MRSRSARPLGRMQDTAFSEAPGRCSASEQPEALSQVIPKKQLLMTSSVCSTQPSLTSTQQQALSAINARLHLLGDYAVEAFKCQLWEPSRAVQELEPGILACLQTAILVKNGRMQSLCTQLHAQSTQSGCGNNSPDCSVWQTSHEVSGLLTCELGTALSLRCSS